MPNNKLSLHTIGVFGLGVVVSVVAWVLIRMGVGGEAGAVAISDIAEIFVVGLSTAFILACAIRLGPKTSIGRPWLFIGLGALAFLVGDVIYSYVEVILQQTPPYPGAADVFYLLEYPLVAVGAISAGTAYRGLVPMKRPAIVAILIGLASGAVVYFGLLVKILGWADVAFAEKLISSIYPLADVFLLIAPALFVLMVVAALGGGRLAWPWWAVGIGAVILAVTDTAYVWLAAVEKYASGSPVDIGWMMGHVFIMLGALIARDMAATKERSMPVIPRETGAHGSGSAGAA